MRTRPLFSSVTIPVAPLSADARIYRLNTEHNDLDAAIGALALSGNADDLTVTRLKKRKLHIKNEIASLHAVTIGADIARVSWRPTSQPVWQQVNASRFAARLSDMTKLTIRMVSSMPLPADMSTALQADAKALAAWQDITPLARNNWIYWVTIVKKVDTPKEQVERLVTQLKEGVRRPYCWPGCSHRIAKAKKWFGPKKAKAAG